MNTLIQSVGLELKRFEAKPTKTGATRIRASLLQIKKLADTMRKEILAESKNIGAKKVEPVAVSDEMPPEQPVLRRETTSVVGGDVIAQEKKSKKARAAKKQTEKK